MFTSANIYKMFKPDSSPDIITEYQVFIGGTKYSPNLASGVVMIRPLSTKDMTSQFKNMTDIADDKEMGKSIIGITYQVDIYKENSKTATSIEVEAEAIKIKEWLKSFEIQEYLEGLDSEILPNYSSIRMFPNEEINKAFINRAGFDFTIITNSEIFESVDIIDKIIFDNEIIINKG